MAQYLLKKELIKNWEIYANSNDKQEAAIALSKCKIITKLIQQSNKI